jgi:hypothetical protein
MNPRDEEAPFDYLSVVEQFFLRMKDSGLALSANDYHLIRCWEEQGVPVQVVCRAIEQGTAEFRGNQPQRGAQRNLSLAYLKPFIDDAIQRETGR